MILAPSAAIILVPFWVGVVIVILGALFWIIEQPSKARKRREAREARQNLARDLSTAEPSRTLPYGIGTDPAVEDASETQ